ncbi:MAG: YggS family pyridoxal phosphate-dependent enzyme [Flavisolibacter sp.]
MGIEEVKYRSIVKELAAAKVTLVAVSKTHPAEAIRQLYELGQRDFGENYVQELVAKQETLPDDIHWHFIGHLQSNKVKYIAPFVHMIQSVDSEKLLKEIDKQAQKNERTINVLLQVHIAQEETKFGLDENELAQIMEQPNAFPHVRICGLMGMASFTENKEQVRKEFRYLKSLFDHYKKAKKWDMLSMGMSSDYRMAVEEGSTLVRIGSLLFGERTYNK